MIETVKAQGEETANVTPENKHPAKLRLSAKLIIILILIGVSSNLLWSILGYYGVSFGWGLFGIGILVIFYFVLDALIVKRTKQINNVVKHVSHGNYGIYVDVGGNDELTELGRNINTMTSELRAKEKMSQNFTRYLSHEFKTPLTVIRSYAEAAQLSKRPEKTEEYLETIIAEADRLAAISATMLELCKLDSTTIIRRDDTVSPAAQIRARLAALQFEWGKKELEIEPELEEFEVKSNGELLSHIWQNLISNAIKYTQEKGKITLTLKKREDSFTFAITDTGVGISPDEQKYIFTPFYVGTGSDKKRDTGLGLPLVKAITEKLGGAITVQSEQNKGSTFTVTLPISE